MDFNACPFAVLLFLKTWIKDLDSHGLFRISKILPVNPDLTLSTVKLAAIVTAKGMYNSDSRVANYR